MVVVRGYFLSEFVDLAVLLIRSVVDKFIVAEEVQVLKARLYALEVFPVELFYVLLGFEVGCLLLGLDDVEGVVVVF